MIPLREVLVEFFDPDEIAALEDLRPILDKMRDPDLRNAQGRRALRDLWPDPWLFMEKTHWLARQKEPGRPKRLKLNYAQQIIRAAIDKCEMEQQPVRLLCLKARQLGLSTMFQSWMFEQCDREPNRSALTLSYDEDSSSELFFKSKHLHNRMWFPHLTSRDSGNVLAFKDNNSSITVRTSGNQSAGRGDTYHYVHMSEVPMWADAGETMNSALNAVPDHAGTAVFVESTAKGAVGEFYDEWIKAENDDSIFTPIFIPWFIDPGYTTPFSSQAQRQAFENTMNLTERRLMEAHQLTLEQLHWRRRTVKGKCQGSEAKFRQEYPSTAREAFLTTGSPVFNADTVAMLEENAVPALWTGDIHLELRR